MCACVPLNTAAIVKCQQLWVSELLQPTQHMQELVQAHRQRQQQEQEHQQSLAPDAAAVPMEQDSEALLQQLETDLPQLATELQKLLLPLGLPTSVPALNQLTNKVASSREMLQQLEPSQQQEAAPKEEVR